VDRTDTMATRLRGRGAGGINTARTITRWLDRLYVDPILGFFLPGAGDLLTGATGVYLVALAIRAGAPRIVVARMLINLTIDVAVGLIPFAGDLFDFAWRANQRNLALLEKRAHMERPRGTTSDWLYVLGAALLFLGVLALPVILLVWALRRAF
jgi:hypothetical protein